MNRIKTALALLSVWALLIWPVSEDVRAQQIFNSQLMTPNGISVDASGNVTVHSVDALTTLLTTFAPDGSQLRQIPLGNGAIEVLRFRESYLASDPDPLTDRLYLLSPEGDIVVFRLSTLQEIGRFNISQDLTVETSNVYDVASSSPTSFGLSPTARYGDIAAFRLIGGMSTVLFVTGLSNHMAFVMLIPMQDIPDNVTEAEVILMSTRASPVTLSRARGIAIDAQGVGLTTLPVPASISACPDAVISFSATAVSLSASNVVPLPGAVNLPSWGVTVDANGFYLVTGGIGNAACLENGDGLFVFIVNTLTGIDPTDIIPLTLFGLPGDIAISAIPANLIYLTIPNLNTVGFFPMSILQLP